MTELKYYVVNAKCGHVGRKNCIYINFAICAENGREAARLIRQTPRVKHDDCHAIAKVEEISYELYCDFKNENDNDPYLMVSSIQEQRRFDLYDRIVPDSHYEEKEKPERHYVMYHKACVRNYRKYRMNMIGV